MLLHERVSMLLHVRVCCLDVPYTTHVHVMYVYVSLFVKNCGITLTQFSFPPLPPPSRLPQ